jgi:hypothetical protein
VRGNKYQPLTDWLATQRGAAAILTFAEVEALLGEPLPVLARITPRWWARALRRPRHGRVWRALGWEVTLNSGAQALTFVRTTGAASP